MIPLNEDGKKRGVVRNWIVEHFRVLRFLSVSIAVAVGFAAIGIAINGARTTADKIQASRLQACTDGNYRNRATITYLNTIFAEQRTEVEASISKWGGEFPHDPGVSLIISIERKQLASGTAPTVGLINAIAPYHSNCKAFINGKTTN